MNQPTIVDIQRGWRVFALAEEVGAVVDVGPNAIDVQTGRLMKHTYRVPETHITEAADGVVDLDVDRHGLEAFELGHDDRVDGDEVPPDELPEAFRRLEYGNDRPDPMDRPDLTNLPR